MSAIFNSAASTAALQAKDCPKARAAYLLATDTDPGDLQNVYQLSIAELQMSPLEPLCFWHIARALALATAQENGAAADSIDKYGRAKLAN
jgi:hypothetical protein